MLVARGDAMVVRKGMEVFLGVVEMASPDQVCVLR